MLRERECYNCKRTLETVEFTSAQLSLETLTEIAAIRKEITDMNRSPRPDRILRGVAPELREIALKIADDFQRDHPHRSEGTRHGMRFTTSYNDSPYRFWAHFTSRAVSVEQERF
jgi:hypothetical protein